ncbi:MAG: ATP-binding protein [Ardenticatenaceae bacterium]|nr:ATP-binding protein [Ardenticatenaceae bacterium]MCB8947984.1 ATP-binding protein [Ardenticatenaceae bacterium]
MTHLSLANYTNEQKLFGDLIQSDSEPNILLFQGESGSGKSHLIEHCLRTASDTPSVLMKLQSGGSIATLFTTMGSKQGWHQLPHFTQTVAALVEEPDKTDDPVWRMGMRRHVEQIGKISDRESQLSRYQLLTDAWFADAQQFEAPFLLALDVYEKASTLFDEWFSREFLAGVAAVPNMRVLVGGQKVPQLRDTWSFCASLKELAGVHEAEAWMAWAMNEGYQPPSLEAMVWIVRALKGNPSQIIQMIIGEFPRKNGPVGPKESVYEQRKRVRENICAGFSISELKNICSDMEINYENLPDHDHKEGFVRELIGYTERVNRYHELIQVLQVERPHLEW